VDKKVIEIARTYAEKVRNYLAVDMIVLYGSHVKGTATESSDIDIAVVVDKLNTDYLKVSTDLFGLVHDVSKRIEPVLLCRSSDRGGFIQSVMREGKIIYSSRQRHKNN
jgi:predicted nucleotidyltransferase